MRFLDWVSAKTARLEQDLADSEHAALYLRQLLRGNRVPATPPETPTSGPPVLLIHGYLANRGSVQLLAQRLQQRDHTVLSYPLSAFGDIRDSAALLARKIESLVEQTSVGSVDLVGHSMGGLAALYYIKRLGGRRRVRKLVLLGTPTSGTWSALLGLVTAPLGRASLQLLPPSAFLRELNESPIPPEVQIVALAGERDFLAPLASTVVAGVKHVALPTGHSGLLVDNAVVDALDQVLRQPR